MRDKIKVKIKDINSPIFGDKKPNFKSIFYGWRRLRKSINTKGYVPEKFSYMQVCVDENTDKKYKIVDGNHRVKILENLYGEDFEVEVELVESPRKVIKGLYDRMVKPLLDSNTSGKVVNVLILGVILWYFFIVNFLATILVTIILWYIMKYFPNDDGKYAKSLMYYPSEDKTKWFNKHPKIYTILLNINKNLRIILIFLFLMTYLIYLATSSFIQLCITLIIIGVLLKIKEITKNKDIDS
tara:strand:- start:353 stop:1075 length:723 start_codon:yes stop_codon:yes gene_type:complete